VRRLAHRLFGELAPLFPLHAREILVLQEAGLGQSLHQAPGDFFGLQPAGDPCQGGPQVQIAVAAIEAFQAFHQRRRNNQHGIREAVRIANEKPRIFGGRRGHEVERHAQTGQWLGQVLWYRRGRRSQKTEDRRQKTEVSLATGGAGLYNL
jgi:hypothetical protein